MESYGTGRTRESATPSRISRGEVRAVDFVSADRLGVHDCEEALDLFGHLIVNSGLKSDHSAEQNQASG